MSQTYAETLVQAKIVNQFNGELYIRYFDSTTPPGLEVRLSSGDTISIELLHHQRLNELSSAFLAPETI